MPIKELSNWKDNPRAIKKDRFEELKDRLKGGEIKPLIVNSGKYVPTKGEVLGGNMRLRAMNELGFDECWVSMVDPKTEAEKITIALTDNEEMGYYEDQVLAELIAKFKEDIDLTKYQIHLNRPKSLAEILQEFSPEEIIEDEVPEVPEVAESKLGEVYQLGRHRLMCGDSTKIEDVEKLMDGKKADISFTSPPYNAGQTPTEVKMGKDSKYLNDNDDKEDEEYFNLLVKSTDLSNKFSEYSFVNLQMLSGNKSPLIDFIYNYKQQVADIIIWNKQTAQPAMAENVLNSQFEFVFVLSEKGNRHIGTKKFRGTLSNLVDISKQTKNKVKEHNATFPVEFAGHFVRNFSEDSVLDLFGGSGSTLIACEQTDRTCYMMELDPHYCDVIRKRYNNFIKGK